MFRFLDVFSMPKFYKIVLFCKKNDEQHELKTIIFDNTFNET